MSDDLHASAGPTGRTGMYRSLQAFRAVAAILVVLYHLGPAIAFEDYFGLSQFASLFEFGGAGVEFFFVLSGFIIFRAHRRDVGNPQAVGRYLKKRFLRIYPTYWIVFSAVFLFAMLTPALQDKLPYDPAVILKSLALVPQDPAIVGGTGAPVIIVAWTLQYEVLFYLFFALLIAMPKAAVLVGIAFTGLILARHCGVALSFPWTFLAKDYVLLFFLGMATACLVPSRSTSVRSVRSGYAVLALVGLAVLVFAVVAVCFTASYGRGSAFTILTLGVASSLVVLGLVAAEDMGVTFGGWRWMQMLGASSYALYLIHYPLISILCKLCMLVGLQRWGLLGGVVGFVFSLSMCIVAAVLFHQWIERRVLAFGRMRRIGEQTAN